jgi:hypothetical protein
MAPTGQGVVAPTGEAVAPTREAVPPTGEVEASDRMVLGAARVSAAFMDHVEVSVDSPVAVGEAGPSVVCLMALAEEAAGAAAACAASAVV